MENHSGNTDTEKYRDKIATVDEHGRRIWIYPKKPKGYFYNLRTYVSWGLLAILFGLPFIKVNGEPLVLLNVLERNLILFGIHFTPQDFHLFVFAMLTLIVFIVLFTVIFGRLFCGWVCPQTIFMEMVFRKIEYWIEGDANAQRRLNKAPWTKEKIFKKVSKHLFFVLISILIAHTFLSYIVGVDQVQEIISQSPMTNLGGFMAMVIFTAAFYFVFSRLREQVCTTICPYGRLQGVLTDKNTILVSYDFIRGEPRGKIRKKEIPAPTVSTGDCVDCTLCVQVCPTGIDIRDGVQLECVNCTACMDACDAVMDKIGRQKGLIRYDSLNGIESKRKSIFTPRVLAYTAVLLILMVSNIAMLGSRSDLEAVILRTPGMLFQKVDENHISNLYNFQIYNKTNRSLEVLLKLKSADGELKMVGKSPVVSPTSMSEGAFFIEMNRSGLKGRKNKVIVQIYAGEKLMDEVSTNFFGPG